MWKNTQNIQHQNESTKTEEVERNWGILLFFPFILLIIVVIASIAPHLNCSDIVNRDLSTSDITYTSSQDLTTYTIIVTPKRNIKQCDVQLTLYNSDGETLYSDTISKTDLKEGYPYAYTFDFGFVNSLSGTRVKYKFTGKFI